MDVRYLLLVVPLGLGMLGGQVLSGVLQPQASHAAPQAVAAAETPGATVQAALKPGNLGDAWSSCIREFDPNGVIPASIRKPMRKLVVSVAKEAQNGRELTQGKAMELAQPMMSAMMKMPPNEAMRIGNFMQTIDQQALGMCLVRETGFELPT